MHNHVPCVKCSPSLSKDIQKEGSEWQKKASTPPTTNKIMNRVVHLETIAAVPGMVAGVICHFKIPRTMKCDGGMFNMFLEEALNTCIS